MRLSTFCILCCLSAGISQAATYVWSGAAGNGIYGDPTTGRWTARRTATSRSTAPMTTPSSGKTPELLPGPPRNPSSAATNTVQVGSGSTLVCTTTIGDLNVNSFTLEGNSHLVFESSNAFGLGRDFTLDFGTFTAAEHGSWTATDLTNFWTNGKTVTFTGTLDMTAFPEAERLNWLPSNPPSREATSIWT